MTLKFGIIASCLLATLAIAQENNENYDNAVKKSLKLV